MWRSPSNSPWSALWRGKVDPAPPPVVPSGPAWRNRQPWPVRRSIAAGLLAFLLAAPATEAGDLLRGGAGHGQPGNPGGVGGMSSAQAAALAKANAQDILARTTQAVQAVQAMQSAAHSGSVANGLVNPANGLRLPDVPNGLAPGGLQFVSGQGAAPPSQTTSGSQTQVTVQQTSSQAVLTWSSFNVGRQTLLKFDQNNGGSQASQWIAFNIVNDPSANPSQILGSIQANGQVFVVNRNGIIFGGSSQVNTHAFYASSLPINTNLISSGLLANPDQQFLFSSLAIPAGTNGTPAFTPPAPYGSDYGDVTVQAGAVLTAPTTAANVGGRVALVGRNVTNNGSIYTPDGQTILAAGRQVGFDAHPSNDPTLRGLDTYVGAVDSVSGTAVNNGLIQAMRGDTTITGKNVQQNGVIDSSTSVTLNGRVDLLADYNATPIQNAVSGLYQFEPQSTGAVMFGAGSVTRILPEWSSTAMNVGTQLPLPSQVIVEGQTIHMGANSLLLAPGATAPPNPNNPGGIDAALDLAGNAMNSGVTFSTGSWVNHNSVTSLYHDQGQISLDAGAAINVAGSTEVLVPVTQNILSVALRGTELANSPTQRDGIFRGTTINVDLRNTGSYNGEYWVGTPLANVAGYVGLIEHNVGELTTAGGSVSLSAGGSVVMQSGSNIDVSGGYIHYTGGMVQTTRVVMNGGNVMNLSQATPDQAYQGIYTGNFTVNHPQWGVTKTYQSPLALLGTHYEADYNQGGNGGSITIAAPTMALDGNLLGNTVVGPRQMRTNTATYASISSDTFSTAASSAPPTPSALMLAFQAQNSTYQTYPTFSPTPPNLVFQDGVTQPATNPANVDSAFRLLGARASTVVLSPELLTQDGFGTLTVDNRDGNITLPAKVALQVAPGGSISLSAANMDIEGSVIAPGGSIRLNVYDLPTSTLNALAASVPTSSPPANLTRGNFTLGANASLSAAGLIVDDREINPNRLTLPLITNGGSVTINSFNTDLLPGSVIDVSGGVAISPTGKKTYGNGGSITVTSGQDLNIPSVLGGSLTLGAKLEGYSAGGGSSSLGAYSGGGNGGSLSIQAPLIQIGGAAAPAGTLALSPDFFSQGGFANFTLTALGVTGTAAQSLPVFLIAPGTVIAPVAQAEVALTNVGGVQFQPVNEPLGIRTPVNLTFNASGISDKYNTSSLLTVGNFVLGAGAIIRTDPTASVSISANTAALLGSIIAPGGSISVTKSGNLAFDEEMQGGTFAVPNIDLGPHSLLSTAGAVVLLPNRQGYLTGSVLTGGTITISGNIVAEAGAVLDVSGTSGVLDLAPAYSGESAPLLGALSGRAAIAQTQMSAPTFRGLLMPLLPDGTTGSATPSGSFSGAPVVATTIDSNAGSITLAGAAELFSDATLRGAAGGPTAVGGTLTISSGRFQSGAVALTPTLQVTQSGPTVPAPFYGAGQTAIGHPVLGTNGSPIPGRGYFTADSFTSGGFDNLVLSGGTSAVSFSGPVSISARGSITVASGGVLTANSTVQLNAPYVELGQPFKAPISSDESNQPFGNSNILPTYGSGRLNVTGQLIDIGTLSLQNIGQATFTAINGDIRGDGTLDVAGNIVMQAGQIYPATGVAFTISASDYLVGGVAKSGSVTILPGGVRQLPLSAAGQLNIYASIINQGGTLRAPLGSINIGWDGTGTAPLDPVTGAAVAIGQQINLLPGSITSVSAIDPISGQGLIIPYGINVNGTSCIDPSATDITANLLPQKSVNISGLNVNDMAGSTVDIRGGGDLLAYQWVSGTGGTNDLLSWNYVGTWAPKTAYSPTQIVSYKGAYYYATTAASAESESTAPVVGPYWNKVTPSYAVVPGYQADYAPYAPYNPAPSVANALNLGVDQGYVHSGLGVGSSVYLSGMRGLTAGVYTLLPARYALLPGAFLVTPGSTAAAGTYSLTSDAIIGSGYSFNALDQTVSHPPLETTFSVASSQVVLSEAAYTTYSANTYLRAESAVLGLTVPRTPLDAGSLVLSGSAGLTLNGAVEGQAPGIGRGALIDISTSQSIDIVGPHAATPPAGTVVLNANLLNSFGAESLLIGGTRQVGSSGTTLTVNTANLTVNNGGAPLVGPEIILVANQNLTLAAGAEVMQNGTIPQNGPSLPLLIGNSATPGSGDGVLLRVSALPSAVVRSGVDTSTTPNVAIGPNAMVSGVNVTVDSTSGGTLDPTATIAGQSVNLSAGRISVVLNNPGMLQTNPGIILQGTALTNLLGSNSLSLAAYQSIDVYGVGTITSGSLGLHAPDLRGFTNDAAGTVTINATNLALDNAPGQPNLGPASGAKIQGTFTANSQTITIGANQINIDQFSNVALNATGGVLLQNSGGLASQTNLTITTPVIVGSAQASQTITAQGGALMILAPAGGIAATTPSAGLGATLNLVGNNITENSRIYLPSGQLNLNDLATTPAAGGITLGGTLDVSGTNPAYYDITEYTPGGTISLSSANGNVVLSPGSLISVAANSGGGNAGILSISAPNGYLSALGALSGRGGAGGLSGTFSLDSKTFDSTASPSIASLDALLNTAGFTQSRSYRVRSGSVIIDGTATALNYSVSADTGSIEVTSAGEINASGATGGTISLVANGNVTLDSPDAFGPGAMLTVAATNFNDAGEGGYVSLEAGSETNGIPNLSGKVNINAGSTIDLSVASVTGATAAQTAANTATAQLYGAFTGILHIRSPQNAGGTDFAIDPIVNGALINPSSVVVEGYHIITLTGAAGTITTSVQSQVAANGNSFVNGNTLLTANPGLASLGKVLSVVPGEELINPTGNITLGTTSTTSSSDWNLGAVTYRFGTTKVPGVLTMRAEGNIVLYNSISDGFSTAAYNSALLTKSALLPANAQDWSYNLTAGADFAGVNAQAVLPFSQLASGTGSFMLGKDYGYLQTSFGSGEGAMTSSQVSTHYQVLRTGSGNITIAAGNNVELLNQLATIYTAGTIVPVPTVLPDGSTFQKPILNATGGVDDLGAVQQPTPSPVQYTLGGGNVVLTAQGSIEHLTTNTSLGETTPSEDSSNELPNNWLYRRSYVNPTTGLFGTSVNGEIASTTWWVDFTNFFEGVGALGGGNVSMVAGGNVSNVDGLIPTNARMPIGVPNPSGLVELGGGDLVVKAGGNIDAGVYYVERGTGTLTAGGSFVTNYTRSPSLQNLAFSDQYQASSSWLPTTLFLGGSARNGASGFSVYANGDVLLGPASNVFLLPEGYDNTYSYKTYFSTYASTDFVNVTSLAGSVTLRETSTSDNSPGAGVPLLQEWVQSVQLLSGGQQSFNSNAVAYFQPWVRIDETATDFLNTALAILPPTFSVTAFSGDINLQGSLKLSPSPTGQVSLLAAGAINGLQPNGVETSLITGLPITAWDISTINLSDANPASVYGITNAFSYQTVAAKIAGAHASNADIEADMTTTLTTAPSFFNTFDKLFAESGQTSGFTNGLDYGSVITQESLHDSSILHANDAIPVRLYTLGGDISGLNLFSGKPVEILAGRDVTDVGLYIQNVTDNSVSVVAAGRDIIPYDANSLLRGTGGASGTTNFSTGDFGPAGLVQTTGNLLNFDAAPLAGDIQIAGPGTLEVLAGRNLNLGNSPSNPAATASGVDLGIVSIGNARNPYLPFAGANILTAAGFGGPAELSTNPNLDLTTFISQYLTGGGSSYVSQLDLGSNDIASLTKEQQAEAAIQVFFLMLRDAGRAHTATGASYGTGFAAIDQLFKGTTNTGSISLTSREIATANGGNIQMLAPHGSVTVGFNVIGQALDQGILTEDGGDINIFAKNDVTLGTSRIFTLRGGNIIIWSTNGGIAAGSASKTVKAAPPTRVLIDPSSADVKTDLAGLATGGGIGVLATVADITPGNVDLIAPNGVVDAGDAGIRATGNLNIAATKVLNANNIQVSGSSTGTPAAAVVVVPNVGGLTSASAAGAAASNSATEQAKNQQQQIGQELPDSNITVEVVGYGGGDGGTPPDSSQ